MAAGGLTGILLVGGAGRRFGSPKALARFEGETLAERAWRTLAAACETTIAVGKRADRLDLPFPVLDDGRETRAALVGIVAGLEQSNTDLNLVLPVDMPLVRAHDLLKLIDACRDAAVPAASPLPCALRRSTLPTLLHRVAAGDLALRDAFGQLDTQTVDIDPATLANVNTPEDLDALQVRIVPLLDEHREAFRDLVTHALAEYGFTANDAFDSDLDDPARVYEAVWVATANGETVGSVALRRTGRREVELKRMYLRPRLRGRGVGRRLLEMAMTWAREHKIERITLDTTEEMAAARHLYEAHGFVRIAGNAPRQGQDRWLYELRL